MDRRVWCDDNLIGIKEFHDRKLAYAESDFSGIDSVSINCREGIGRVGKRSRIEGDLSYPIVSDSQNIADVWLDGE